MERTFIASDWNPERYLEFAEERTRPARDLLTRVAVDRPARVLDVGCGPGNSTALLAARWPDAAVIGMDSSPAMIDRAKQEWPDREWLLRDAGGDLSDLGRYDVVFSNAALQWIPNHERLVSGLFGLLEQGGVLAVQVPHNADSPMHRTVRRVAESPAWRMFFAEGFRQIYDSPETYYRYLCRMPAETDLWETVYYHLMNSVDDILAWSRGTLLRVYVENLPDARTVERFEREVMELVTPHYQTQPDGRVLFPFKRLFFTARNKS